MTQATTEAAGRMYLFRVAVWPYRLDAGRQLCDLRPVCGVCGWKGKTRTTENAADPRQSPEGDEAAREMLRHAANRHTDTYHQWRRQKGLDA